MLYESTRIFHDVFCTIAIVINILLVIIILTKTPDKLSSYSIILLNFAIIEIASAATSLFLFNRSILLTPRDNNNYSLFASAGACRFTRSSRVCFAASSFLSHGHCHFYILLGFSFCYRYIAIKRSTPSKSHLYSLLAIVYAPTVLVFTIFGASPLLDSTALKKVMSDNHPKYDFEACAGHELLIGVEKNTNIRLGMAWFQGVLIPTYALLIITSVLIHRLLSSSLRMSEKSKKMHKEIMQGLIFQAMLPLFYVVVLGVNQAFEKRLLPDWEENGYLQVTVSAMTLAASPISTLLFIRPYRRALVSTFACCCSSISESTTESCIFYLERLFITQKDKDNGAKQGEFGRVIYLYNQNLHTSIPLLAPLWMLSTITGALFTYSPFFGGLLSLLLAYTVLRQAYCIKSVERVSVKAAEVAILNLFVPILSAFSLISSVHFPHAAITLNFVLVSIAYPHLELLWRWSKKMNHYLLLAYSIITLASALALVGFSFELGFVSIVPTVTTIIYALLILCRALFLLRSKMSVSVLKYAVLMTLLACIIEWTVFYFSYPEISSKRVPALTAETIAIAAVFGYLEFLEILIRQPSEDLSNRLPSLYSFRQSTRIALRYIFCKIFALLIIAMFAAFAPLTRWLDYAIAEGPIIGFKKRRKGATPEEEEADRVMTMKMFDAGVKFVYSIVILIVHQFHYSLKKKLREKEPLVITALNTRTIFGICCISAVIIAKMAIAIYYCLTTNPRAFPPYLLLALTAFLFLLLIAMLDFIRNYVAPFNNFLATVALCISIFAALLAILLACTAPEDPTKDCLSKLRDDSKRISQIIFLLSILLFLENCYLNEEIDRRWMNEDSIDNIHAPFLSSFFLTEPSSILTVATTSRHVGAAAAARVDRYGADAPAKQDSDSESDDEKHVRQAMI